MNVAQTERSLGVDEETRDRVQGRAFCRHSGSELADVRSKGTRQCNELLRSWSDSGHSQILSPWGNTAKVVQDYKRGGKYTLCGATRDRNVGSLER